MDHQFERDKLCYEQHSESFRHLNAQLWQVPIIAMTLTGGLWFGVYNTDLPNNAAAFLLLFCGFCDLLFILILHRVRYIMGQLIEKLALFNPSFSIETRSARWPLRKNTLVVWMFSIMLFMAALISTFTAIGKFISWLC